MQMHDSGRCNACRADGLDALQQLLTDSAPEGVPAVAGGLRVGGPSALHDTVQLLAACWPEELHRLEELSGPKKTLAVFRSAS